MIWSRIAGTGSYLPERVVTNADLARSMDTSDEWIRGRTGIGQRHIADESQGSSDLALKACEAAGVWASAVPAVRARIAAAERKRRRVILGFPKSPGGFG